VPWSWYGFPRLPVPALITSEGSPVTGWCTMNTTTTAADDGQSADAEPRLVSVSEDDGAPRYVYAPERSCRVRVEHDREKRLFRIKGPDGRTRAFCDEPVRFVVVGRDPRTGETMPILRYGEPEYLDLCRSSRLCGFAALREILFPREFLCSLAAERHRHGSSRLRGQATSTITVATSFSFNIDCPARYGVEAAFECSRGD
jgi:hypothetical protein